MSREKELFKNTLVLGLGQFLPKFLALITLPIVTAQLTKAEYGTYDLITTLVSLVLPAITLQIQSAAFRFLIDCRNNQKRTSDIITNIFIAVIPISLVASVAFFFVLSKIEISLRLLIIVYFMSDMLFLSVSQIVRGLGNNKTYSVSSVLLSIINCICIIETVQVAHLGLYGVIASLCCANCIAVVYMVYKSHLISYICINNASFSIIKQMLQYSWPMVPNNLSGWVLRVSDRLVISTFLGVEANAIYAVANKIPSLLMMAQSVFIMAWHENASISVNDKDVETYYTKMFEEMFLLVISLTGLLIGATPLLFFLLIKGSYEAAYLQMPILILGLMFYCLSAFQGGIYIAHKKTISVGISTVVAAVINLVVNLCLVKFIGITAGSVSTLVAYLALYLYRRIDVIKFQHITYRTKEHILLLLVIALMSVLFIFDNVYFNILNIIISILMASVLEWKMIRKMFEKLKKR